MHGTVKVWQEQVELPTSGTGEQDSHPMFLENRVYQGSSGAVYPYGVIDTGLSVRILLPGTDVACRQCA
ncbi:Uncharacterised protein [Serratia proteamaculans]|nr:hypothetical protein [Serratia proteamaculans]KAB1495432.1 hypothetical protein F8R23_17170 [Serratia proteamaculans]RYM48013.1 hypothetical protein BSQ96_23305 [Serratia proteamaculans]RYM49893.1 hypothetical protein BSQ97_18455 [Serratia proteamaculans]CAI0998969.1 Uncharacterised protein [Serratia proteamaculans]CAI1032937.1 Uncharacterised protein [Serratia proteamaculans]